MKKNAQILNKAFSFGSVTGLSRILGFFRDIAFAHFFGTKIFADAFYTAFTFPNLFRKLFGEGAFSGAFIPVFSDANHKDESSSWKFLNTVLTVLLLLLTTLTAVVLISLYASTYFINSERVAYIIKLTQIMFPYIILICSLGFMFGVFNYFGYYALPAFSSVLLNIILITGIFASMLLFPDDPTRIVFLAWLVLSSGLAQWLFYCPLISRIGIPLKLQLAFDHPDLKPFCKLYLPSVFAISIMQINVFFDRIMAVLIGPGAPSSLYYANRIYQLPLGVFAVSIALAALPEFSKSVSRQDIDGLVEKLHYSLKLSLFAAIPSSIGLMILSKPIIKVIFERGAFTHESTLLTAFVLACYAIGLFTFSNIKTLTYAFYALKDSVTPTKIAFACLMLNIFLNILLMSVLGVAGIALATSISVTVNVFLLLAMLSKKLKKKVTALFLQTSARYLILSSGMGIIVYGVHRISSSYMNSAAGETASLLLSVVTGILSYLGLSLIFARKELKSLLSR